MQRSAPRSRNGWVATPASATGSRSPPAICAWTLRSPSLSCWPPWDWRCSVWSSWPSGPSSPGMYPSAPHRPPAFEAIQGLSMTAPSLLYHAADLIAFARDLFAAAGCDDDKPQVIAELLVEADL